MNSDTQVKLHFSIRQLKMNVTRDGVPETGTKKQNNGTMHIIIQLDRHQQPNPTKLVLEFVLFLNLSLGQYKLSFSTGFVVGQKVF